LVQTFTTIVANYAGKIKHNPAKILNMAKKIEPPNSFRDLPLATIKQMLTLATSGFGLVAALAWNEVIKESVNLYIRPHFAKGSGLISLLIYAVAITALAVIVTLQLTKLQTQLESSSHPKKPKKKN